MAAAAVALAGCAAKQPPAPAPRPAPPLAETPLPPSGTAEFAIGEIKEQKSEDQKELFVEGTVRNTGSRTSREVKVWVEGRDANDAPVARAEALPTPQEIPPDTVARYVVRLPNDPAIRTFHVEAIGR